jgi:hypothetical protein
VRSGPAYEPSHCRCGQEINPVVVGEFGGYYSGNVNHTGRDLNLVTCVFGPRVSFRRANRLTPFAEVLIGGGHAGGSLYSGINFNRLRVAERIRSRRRRGLDAKLANHLAVRLIQADYLLTRFKNGSNDHQNNLRLSVGLAFGFGRVKTLPF